MSAPAERPDGRGRWTGTLAGVLAGVLVFLLIVIGLLLFSPDADDEPDPIAGSPLPEPTEPTPTDEDGTPTATPSPDPDATATPTATPTPTDREPTDADAAAFTSGFEPPGAASVESVTVDLTDDGRAEVVVASVTSSVQRLDVATWTGAAYEVTFSDLGGPGDTLEEFLVRDVNGDGGREIVTVQSGDGGTANLAVWGWDGQGFVRQEADGGCWDGSHVYGVVGAELRDGEIVATCDGAPLPPERWSRDVYAWDDGAWRYQRTEQP